MKTQILGIKVNEKDGITTVCFGDDVIKPVTVSLSNGMKLPLGLEAVTEKDVIETKTVGGDLYDPYIGVALALAAKLFGGKRKFREFVNKKAGIKEKNYDGMTLEQLRKEAQQLGIKGYTKIRKVDLLAKVKELSGYAK